MEELSREISRYQDEVRKLAKQKAGQKQNIVTLDQIKQVLRRLGKSGQGQGQGQGQKTYRISKTGKRRRPDVGARWKWPRRTDDDRADARASVARDGGPGQEQAVRAIKRPRRTEGKAKRVTGQGHSTIRTSSVM